MPEIAFDFLAGINLSSYLIERFGFAHGGWSHVAPVLADGRYLDARWDKIAGVAPGVHLRDPKTEKWLRKRRATLEVDEATYADWEANLRAKVTAGYGVDDIWDFIDGREKHIRGRWICSALAINSAQHIGRRWRPPRVGYVPYPLPIAAHEVTPDACFLVFATAGFTLGAEEHA